MLGAWPLSMPLRVARVSLALMRLKRMGNLVRPVHNLRSPSGGKFAFFRPFDDHRSNSGREQVFEIKMDTGGRRLIAFRRTGSRL
jgi:hypothetical protein